MLSSDVAGVLQEAGELVSDLYLKLTNLQTKIALKKKLINVNYIRKKDNKYIYIIYTEKERHKIYDKST